jgi:ArsR family transcriptional regulator
MIRVLATLECAPASYETLMPASDAEQLATVLKALADPVRLRLLRLVADSPDTTACACHLPTALGISQPTLSHHLKRLVESGLLHREQRGRWVHYRLDVASLGPIAEFVTACAA